MKVYKTVKSKQLLLSYLLGCNALLMGLVVNTSKSAIAQITPDNTLGAESSTINHGALKDSINGGATRGTNLFHSFQEFGVDAGKSVYFVNPTGIENILTRVTGANVSNILGTLGVEGTANLLLINPNGISFGKDAVLDIRGSFTATTADGIKLGENGLFSAKDPGSSILLSVQPGALFVNAVRNQPSYINNEGDLKVGENLTFDADNINILGNLQSGRNLNLKANYTIVIDGSNINTDNYGTVQGGDINITTGSLYLTNASILSASTFGQGDAGSVKITATDSIKFDGNSAVESAVAPGAVGKAGGVDISTKTLELLGGSYLSASTFGEGDAGTVKITATDSVKFDGNSVAESAVAPGVLGKAGGVDISTKTLELLGGSKLSTSTFGEGDAGTVKITATDSVKFDGGSSAGSVVQTDAVGKAGGVDISTKTLELLGGSLLSASTFGVGDAGIIKITATDSIKFDGNSSAQSAVIIGVGKAGGVDISTKTLELLGGSFLDTSTVFIGKGDAGTVKITATDSVKFDGQSYAESVVREGAVGNAGGVDITTKTQELLDGSFLSARTLSQGDAGTVKITATDSVKFDGQSYAESVVKEGAVGNAGGVDISTKSLELLDGSFLSASTFSQGDAGSVKITANTLNISNNSTIKTNTSSSGNAGDILVNTSTLNLTNGGNIFAFTNGSGNGGTVTINALNSVNIGEGVQNFAPIISVETNNTGKAGDIIINSPNFTLSETARITATATETATNKDGGGSITLNASKMNLAGIVGIFAETQGQAPAGTLKLNTYQNQPDLDMTLFPGSIISASTTASGKGGDLQITAPENINITGQGKLAVESKGTGNAGNILITSQNLNLSDGVKISASTSGSGKGGNIIVKVRDKITLDGTNTGLFASTEKGSIGDSGSIDIDPQIFMIKNGAGIGVNSQGTGKGGDIKIEVGTLNLDNNAFINAATASSQGGDITLQIKDLLFMRHNSNITATAGTDQSGGNGGNINMNSPFIVALPNENSDITANAYQGNGGKINIKTNAIFGLKYQSKLTDKSDITASSEFGVSGNVEITTPGRSYLRFN